MPKFELSDELKEKLKACKTPEEVMALAQENNMTIDLEDAKQALSGQMKSLSADELEQVAGGCCWQTCSEQAGC